MDYQKEFERMMKAQTEIAIATSVENVPNVRIVNFYYDENLKRLYFSTFRDNQKVSEFEKNPQVAFTTIPTNGEEHIRIRNGIAKISSVSVDKIKGEFLAKMPDYLMSIPEVLPELVLYEITFSQADVAIDFEHIGNIEM